MRDEKIEIRDKRIIKIRNKAIVIKYPEEKKKKEKAAEKFQIL